MEIQNIHLKNLIKTIEFQCSQKYPHVLEDIQICILKIKYILPEIINEFKILRTQVLDQLSVDPMILSYAKIFIELDKKEIYYIDKKSVIQFIESAKSLNQIKLFFHSLTHVYFKNQAEANRAIKFIRTGIQNLGTIFEDFKVKLFKHSQVYFYFNEKIEYINMNVYRFSEELKIILSQKDIDGYYQQFNALFNMYQHSLNNFSSKETLKYIHLKKERKMLIQKLKILLEYPKFLAYEYVNFYQAELDLSQSISINKCSNFKTIVNYLRENAFIENYLLLFSIEDVVQTIRILHN